MRERSQPRPASESPRRSRMEERANDAAPGGLLFRSEEGTRIPCGAHAGKRLPAARQAPACQGRVKKRLRGDPTRRGAEQREEQKRRPPCRRHPPPCSTDRGTRRCTRRLVRRAPRALPTGTRRPIRNGPRRVRRGHGKDTLPPAPPGPQGAGRPSTERQKFVPMKPSGYSVLDQIQPPVKEKGTTVTHPGHLGKASRRPRSIARKARRMSSALMHSGGMKTMVS